MADGVLRLERRRGAVPWHWHLARWRHVEPGARGLLLLALLSVALLVPIELFGADVSWTAQARTIATLGVLAAAAMFGRSSALTDDAEYWLVHLGHSPADWAFARWTANLLPLAALALLWTGCLAGMALASGATPSLAGLSGFFVQLVVTALVITTMLLLLGALGVTQTVEVGMLLLFATVFYPLAADRVPVVVDRVINAVLPPLLPIATLRDAAVEARWRDAATTGLRIGTWIALALVIAMQRLARRLPR